MGAGIAAMGAGGAMGAMGAGMAGADAERPSHGKGITGVGPPFAELARGDAPDEAPAPEVIGEPDRRGPGRGD
jgi:hypothetical protein